MIDKEFMAACEFERSTRLFDEARPGFRVHGVWRPLDMRPSYAHAQAERRRIERAWDVIIPRKMEREVQEMSTEELDRVLALSHETERPDE